MASQPLIPPFWTRVPRFFLFPLIPSALWRVLLFAAIPALGAFATSPQSIKVATLGLSLLAWVFLLRFGSRVLSETSLGRLSPAQYPDMPDESLAHMPYKIMLLFIAAAIAVGLVKDLFGPEAAIAANFVLNLVMPAALMATVLSRSLFTGLNPAAAWSLIRDIGSPYLLLCVFLFFLSSAQMFLIIKVVEHNLAPLMLQFSELEIAIKQAMQAQDEEAFNIAMQGMQSFFQHMRPSLAGAIWLMTAVAMHFTLIGCNMMGYVLYQFHEQLGLEVDVLPGRRSSAAKGANPAKAAEDAASQRIAECLAEGQVDQALEVAYEAQRLDPENTVVQERYNKLLHLAGKDDRLLNHGQKLIPLLLRKDQKRGALEAWKRCREKQPAFRPEDAAVVLQLAEAARASREPNAAMEILNGFEKAFRNSPLLAEAYFLGGQILCEDLRQDELAETCFAALANHFPDHPRLEDAKRLRLIMARMAQQGTAA